MTGIPRSWWIASITSLLVASVAPLIGRGLRNTISRGCCTLDGTTIEPAFAVHVVDNERTSHMFCSLACAEWWLNAKGIKPEEIYVTDETTGKELRASDALYVRSRVITRAHTRERRHVFADLKDARKHAESLHGRLLVGESRPFSGAEGETR